MNNKKLLSRSTTQSHSSRDREKERPIKALLLRSFLLPQAKEDSAYSHTVRGLGRKVSHPYQGVMAGTDQLITSRSLRYFGVFPVRQLASTLTQSRTLAHILCSVDQSDRQPEDHPKNDENESEEAISGLRGTNMI